MRTELTQHNGYFQGEIIGSFRSRFESGSSFDGLADECWLGLKHAQFYQAYTNHQPGESYNCQPGRNVHSAF
ncbi:hypothetical protein EMIT053CA3_30233 [Pseudomonas donghuensis]